MNTIKIGLASVFLFFAAHAKAVLEIEITQGIEGAIPVAVIPFTTEGGTPPQDVGGIVNADLGRSGLIATTPADLFPQRITDARQINHPAWSGKGIENIVIGSVQTSGQDNYVVEFQLIDTISRRRIMGNRITARGRDLRRVGHKISDLVFEKLTGKKGAFSTRIAFINTEELGGGKKRYVLQVADSDGYSARRFFASKEPLMSPAWSPDGQRIAYVSFENKRAEIYVQDISGGSRIKVTNAVGINSAPAWSPDGKWLAFTHSKNGNPDIYVMELATRAKTRLTKSRGIDTEPVWMPDGKTLVFTSDRSGKPQLYTVSASGGRSKRLTFDGIYNADADVSPDGKQLAMVHNKGQGFRIAVMDLANGDIRVLSDGRLDEAPSFAPNGVMIVYATVNRGRGVLAAVSEDGRVKQRLRLQEGGVREPVWSPFRE